MDIKWMKFYILTALLIGIVFAIFFSFFYNIQTTYRTNILESVSGLKPGARVEYNGVIVGEVTRIKIDLQNSKQITVLMNIDESTPVTTATVAMLAFNDSHAAPFISLTDDGSSKTKLQRKPDQRYAVIPSIISTKANVNTSLTQIARSLQQMNDTLQTLMTKDNMESFRELLYSMQVVMNMMAQNNARLNHIIINTEKASDQFDKFMSSGRLTIQTLQNETLPSTYRLMNNMEELLVKMDSIMSDIKQNPAVILRGRALPPPGPSE